MDEGFSLGFRVSIVVVSGRVVFLFLSVEIAS